jgi:hypothetical protein
MRLTIGKFFALAVLLAVFDATAQISNCTPSEDIPDAAFIDSNCDGIDGDIAKSFFVATTGSDANPGTMVAPFLTINRAILAAATDATRKHVLVAAGTYVETVTLSSGVSLYGLYDSALWRRSPANITTVAAPGATALVVPGYSGTGAVEGFQLIAANATGAGASSYAARIENVSGTLAFRYNVLRPGDGGPGQAGMRGVNGRNGGNGGAGDPGCENSGYPCGSCTHPLPGAGGASFVPDFFATRGGLPGRGSNFGETAPDAPGFNTTTGTGVGGRGGEPSGDGWPGGEGANGGTGSAGAGGPAIVLLSGSLYLSSNGGAGGSGVHGKGGAGGGGGGGGGD